MNENIKSMRHSCEHILTMAILRLFPGVKMAMGPATDEGFYFDFDYDGKISEDDFPKIEKEMKKIIKSNLAFEYEEISIQKARDLFKDNEYKQEWIDEIEKKGEKATIYRTGDEFVDLCSGPHIQSTKEIGPFKLLSIAGAYWRGDEKNKMLTRIYATCFPSQEELDQYLHMLEEARKRDHRKLGKELDLFFFSNLVGAGLPLWTPKGMILRELLDSFVWQLRKEKGYQKVSIPHITKKDLYETSGHWNKFKDELMKINTREGHEFAMKPMNCPHHTQIFGHVMRSYKEMPQRYAETTMVYRDEQTGELNGLSRVRCITQDDAHVFCRYEQIKDEFMKIWDIVERFYGTFGFDLDIRLSLHDPDNFSAYLGTPDLWEKAEDQIRDIAKERKVTYKEKKGEAAFYGPKIDFMAKDSIGREWQVATIQLDINMPDRFDLYCINEKGEKERIVMIHAAIMGAIERFLSVLIEHYAGAFPVWLSPVQVAILPVSDKVLSYAQNVKIELAIQGIRVEMDDSSNTLGHKIRTATLQKVPYMVILGEKEVAAAKGEEEAIVAPRSRDKKDLGAMHLSEFISLLKQEIDNKK